MKFFFTSDFFMIGNETLLVTGEQIKIKNFCIQNITKQAWRGNVKVQI